ncbi:MAG: acetyl-CoA C-acyltransferase [Thauera sp.]|jgi:acetyl-CoA acyltransferase|uniref:acetyl-CoA C-acyltransferase n=1 Tax=Thauera sp. TaxID=1905334 RepID=UPI00260864C8|nr:acetyl-CoA C-acyltransferase [Thauera sp.]MCP5226550.1 acetyl-CoA C-acyltransferase [Thauera sp.]HPE04318.1 acetyl-CoA C-acyltransferase [Thauera sp.]
MSKQIQDAYIVAAVRTPVAKRNGAFRAVRPDDMLATVLRGVLAKVPSLDPSEIGDVVTGCAMPEAEQGMNVARIGLLLAGLPDRVPGITINRFCASGLQAVADAASRIRLGEADVMIAAGTESMSAMPQIMGNKVSLNPEVFARAENVSIAYGMGLTAEKVAQQWKVSREDQDAFAVESHRRACAAIAAGHFKDEILPYAVKSYAPGADGTVRITERLVEHDEGPRPDAAADKLGKLRPVFAARGSVTAGNSSQMSDGAAAVLLMSEAAVRRYDVKPIARFASFAVAGVPPEVMGIGPVEAIPRALTRAGVAMADLGWTELNEAFAAQALAVMRQLEMDPAKVNPLGGAIALGHPLGATGAIRTATLMAAMQRDPGLRYGMISMCIGTGMGAAGVFERV